MCVSNRRKGHCRGNLTSGYWISEILQEMKGIEIEDESYRKGALFVRCRVIVEGELPGKRVRRQYRSRGHSHLLFN